MKTIVEYIDALKERYKLKSYYSAMNQLKMPRQSWTKIKDGGGISDENAIKLARELHINPIEIMAVSRALGAKNRETRNVWLKLAKEKETERVDRKANKESQK